MAKTNYESVIILTPVLSEKMLSDAVESYKKLITGNGGELIHEENWGLTKLAYPIQKKNTGFYQIFEFAAEPDAEIVDILELAYRRDEQVLRYLSIKLDKHAVIYNERRRNGAFNKPKSDNKPVAAKPVEAKPVEAKPVAAPVETKPVEAVVEPVETKPAEAKPVEAVTPPIEVKKSSSEEEE